MVNVIHGQAIGVVRLRVDKEQDSSKYQVYPVRWLLSLTYLRLGNEHYLYCVSDNSTCDFMQYGLLFSRTEVHF